MVKLSFFIYLLWTNLPLFIIGYFLITAQKSKSKLFLLTGLVGIIGYLFYIGTLFFYLKDNSLKYLSYIIKLVGPIYIVYLMIGVRSKDCNKIMESITILSILLFLGIWRVYFQS